MQKSTEVSQLIKTVLHRAQEMTKKNAYACSLMYSFIYLIDDEVLSIYLLNLYLASFKGKVLNYRL